MVSSTGLSTGAIIQGATIVRRARIVSDTNLLVFRLLIAPDQKKVDKQLNMEVCTAYAVADGYPTMARYKRKRTHLNMITHKDNCSKYCFKT